MAKVVFMGSPAFAVPSLRALHAAGHEIVAVYSQPPRPAGRGQKLQKTAVHELADELGLKVYTPARLRGDDLEFVMGLEADVFCVVAYGLLLPKRMVDERLCLNVHPSALPRWRGAAPLQWTLLSGDEATDICVMRLDEGMDTGPVVAREHLKLNHAITLGELHDMTATMGAEMLEDVVGILPDIKEVAQEGEATLAPKITKEMRVIDWNNTSTDIHNHVRSMSPSPAATSQLGAEVFKILETDNLPDYTAVELQARGPAGNVAGKAVTAGTILDIGVKGILVRCGSGAVRIVKMQRAGSKVGAAYDVATGWPAMDEDVVLG